ncbi:hypothetical protein CKJ90_31845, partial [Klebsiella pneumoniae]
EMAKHRLVPVKRLISKLGLDPWYQEAPLTAVSRRWPASPCPCATRWRSTAWCRSSGSSANWDLIPGIRKRR